MSSLPPPSTPLSPGHGSSQPQAPTTIPNTFASSPGASPAPSPRPLYLGIGIVVALLLVTLYFVITRWDTEYTDDAYVEAHLTSITAKVPAYVEALHVDDNSPVTAGQLLVELDPRDYRVALNSAQANFNVAVDKLKEAHVQVSIADGNISEARATLDVAKADASLAAANLKRVRSVGDSRAISNEQVDTVIATDQAKRATVLAAETRVRSLQSNADLARSQVETASAAVAQAQSSLDQAQLNLSYTRIISVINGNVANKSVEEGNYVTPGQTLLTVVPSAPFVVANFKETQLRHMKVGQHVDIYVDAYPQLNLLGRIESFQHGSGSEFALLPPENATGNFVKVVQRVPVKILFDNLGDAAKRVSPGMSVEVKVHLEE
jgi:membrane fusion protein (multidrug efflux system)